MRQSNYVFEIQVNDKPVYEYEHRGDTFIEGRKGSTFKINFRNTGYGRVLIVPAVDGLSTLDGKTAGPDSPGLIVESMGSVSIPGWMVDSAVASQFEFQDRESSYAKSLDSTTTNTGVIGLLVYEEKPQHRYYPSLNNMFVGAQPLVFAQNMTTTARGVLGPQGDQGPQGPSGVAESLGIVDTSASYDSNDNLGVGWGKAVDFQTKTVTFDRGELKAQMAIFYDSRKNLERRGIVVERRDTLGIRPNPFPGIGCTPPKGWSR